MREKKEKGGMNFNSFFSGCEYEKKGPCAASSGGCAPSEGLWSPWRPHKSKKKVSFKTQIKLVNLSLMLRTSLISLHQVICLQCCQLANFIEDKKCKNLPHFKRYSLPFFLQFKPPSLHTFVCVVQFSRFAYST